MYQITFEDYLEILSWLPEEVEEVKSLCNSSNGQAREAGFKALIRNAARETPRTSEAIEEALHFFERRLKNEQDGALESLGMVMHVVILFDG